MICPKCTSPLHRFEIEGSEIDFCLNCKGIWFDKDELYYFVKLHAGSQQEAPGSRETKCVCPRCGKKLYEKRFGSGDGLDIDQCEGCRGIWLDAGELVKAQAIADKIRDDTVTVARVLRGVKSQELEFSRLDARRSWAWALVLAGLIFAAGAMWLKSRPPAPSNPQASPPVLARCPDCGGSGKIIQRCETCNGMGRIAKDGKSRSVSCPTCNGMGKLVTEESGTRCQRCGGTGMVPGEIKICQRCGGRGQISSTRSSSCHRCGGSGRLTFREQCWVCRGSGKIPIVSLFKECSQCGGRGTLEVNKPCPECGGTGSTESKESSRCPDCGGRGRMETGQIACEVCLGSGLSESKVSRTCWRCNGLGSIQSPGPDSEICSSCNGKGDLGKVSCKTCGGDGVL